MSISEDIKALEEALAGGPTPGEWTLGRLASYTMDGQPCRFFYRGENDNAHTRTRVCGGEGDNGQTFNCDADAAYIAACSPDRIRRLLDALKEYRESAISFALESGPVEARLSKAIYLLEQARDWVRFDSYLGEDIAAFLREAGK